MVDNAVVSDEPRLEAIQLTIAPVEGSSPSRDCARSPLKANGHSDNSSAITCAATTTIVVRPSVALGFARM